LLLPDFFCPLTLFELPKSLMAVSFAALVGQ